MSKSFTRGRLPVRVLDDVSLEVSTGELFVIYGKRASGKTTLLEIVAGLAAPDHGTVSFDGRDLAQMSSRMRSRLHRDHVGWVERTGPRVADLRVREHVALPLYRKLQRREAQQRAIAVLRRVGVGDYANARWTDLPDTARAFVAIAEALIREPALLVADDPIYGLGVTEREAVTGLLRDLAHGAGIGVLLAVPDLHPMLAADHGRILAGGKLIGPPPEGGADVIDLPQPRSA